MRKLFLCVASDSQCTQYWSLCVSSVWGFLSWIDGYDVLHQLLLIPGSLAQSVRMTTCQAFEKSYYIVLRGISASFNGIAFYRFG